MTDIENAARLMEQAGVPFAINEPLSRHTSFQIGGPAAVFASPRSTNEVAAAIGAAKEAGVPYMVLGKGSNALFLDEGYHGVLVHLGQGFSDISLEDGRIEAAAGADLNAVCRAALKAGLSGLEFAYGIPGSLGGAVYMNAGAYDGEMCDVLETVTYLDGEGHVQTAGAKDLELGYRHSVFQENPWCILSACVRLRPGNAEEIAAKMLDLMNRREDKQPLDKPSAGSAFKRPPGAFAGALIDECGLRGYRVGGAAISEKHCGFIVNLGGATCADVLALADHVCATVKEQTGYTLEKEIRVIDSQG